MTRVGHGRTNRAGHARLQGVVWSNAGQNNGVGSPGAVCSLQSVQQRGSEGEVNVERLRHGGYSLTRM